jgi:hypothetical protein
MLNGGEATVLNYASLLNYAVIPDSDPESVVGGLREATVLK